MKLTELQKQITPLPWTASKLVWAKDGKDSGEHAISPIGANFPLWCKNGQSDSRYAAHCCNNFGPLVEALQTAHSELERLHKIHYDRFVGKIGEPSPQIIELAKQALATAETVKDL